MKITALKPLSSDPLHISVRVGRQKVATLTHDQIRDLELKVGTEWTDDLADRVAALDAEQQAYRDALRIVRRRAVGTAELRQKLQRKRHDDAPITAALERLTDAGYLDDRAYAESLVRTELARKPAGPALLRAKLYRKHLPRDVIEAAVSAADQQTDHLAAARQLAEKKLATTAMQRADPATRHRRLTGLLARRGFDADTIRQTLAGLREMGDA